VKKSFSKIDVNYAYISPLKMSLLVPWKYLAIGKIIVPTEEIDQTVGLLYASGSK
jgi:hypothetical protein